MGTHHPLPPSHNGDYVPNTSLQEKTDKQKAIDEWLPINSSRSRKWWFSAFHNVTAMVGAGVLSLPYAMSQLGWGPDTVMGTHHPLPPSHNGDYVPNTSLQEKTDKQKAIDEWLPINSSRSRKWWFSAFHNVTAMVGAGVLSLPYAMSQLGWGPGVFIMVFSWIITLYTLWQMVEMHELVPGKRFDRYHELGQYAFGDKLVGVLLMLLSPIGGLRTIIIQAKDYRFYS
ncbi:hypothetical protein GQ457_02G012310 [Hibiscus cannabinus]